MSKIGFIKRRDMTRAQAVIDVANGWREKDGNTFSAGKDEYVFSAGATSIPDMPGVLPFLVASPSHFGAVGSNVTLDTPALLIWANYVARVGKIGYLNGKYRSNADLDFTQGGTVAASGLLIYGNGVGNSEIMWDRNTATKSWMMRFNWFGSADSSFDVEIKDLTLRGEFSSRNKVARNGILAINNHRWSVSNVRILYAGDVPLYLTRTFNSDLYNVKLSESGWQEIHKREFFRASTAAGSSTVSLTEGPNFTSEDVGKDIYIDNSVRRVNSRDLNSPGCYRIVSVVSGTQVTVSPAPTRTISGSVMSWGKVTCSTTAGSTTLTLSAAVLEAADVGRLVWIPGAGVGGGVLHTTIESVTDASTAVLGYAATAAVSNVDYTTAVQLHLGGQPDQYTSQPDPRVNDIEMNNIQIESYDGCGIFCGSGVNVFGDQIKLHGRTASGDSFVANSGPAILNTNCNNVSLSAVHMEFNCAQLNKGVIVCCGELYGMVLRGMTWDGETANNCLVTVPALTQNWGMVNIANFQSRAIWDLHGGDWLDAGNALARSRSVMSGPVFDPEVAGGRIDGTYRWPVRLGADRLWGGAGTLLTNNSDPSSASDGAIIRAVHSTGVSENGLAWVRYTDGDAEVYGSLSFSAPTMTATGAIYMSPALTISIPEITFLAQPRFASVVSGSTSYSVYAVPTYSQSPLVMTFRLWSYQAATVDPSVRVFMRGRWR